MLDFYGPLLVVMAIVMLQATFAQKGKLANTFVVAILFTFSVIFIFSNSYWLFLLIFINLILYLLVCICYFTRDRFITF